MGEPSEWELEVGFDGHNPLLLPTSGVTCTLGQETQNKVVHLLTYEKGWGESPVPHIRPCFLLSEQFWLEIRGQW